jgi:hypothetical protein
MTTLLVSGSRTWDNLARVRWALAHWPAGTTLHHGDCRGLDRQAAAVARALGFRVVAHPARWRPGGIYDPGAGVKRNQAMLAQAGADLLLAFCPTTTLTPGTADMLRRARRAGLPAWLVTPVGVWASGATPAAPPDWRPPA